MEQESHHDPHGPSYPPPDVHPGQTPGKRKRSERGESSGLRTAIACTTCRDRKTRCSGDQPTCNYCKKAGIECVYSPGGSVSLGAQTSSAGLEQWGNKILDAIDRLADRVPSAGLGDSIPSPQGPLDDRGADSSYVPIESPTHLTGLSSILSWKVFSPISDAFIRPLSHPRRVPKHGQESSSTSRSDLLELLRAFESYYLPIIPIFDVSQLEIYIAHIAENGPEWTSESCLVFLVAALGCICQHTTLSNGMTPGPASTPRSTSSTPSVLNGVTAFRYWSMAKKRLGWAFEQSGLLSAQCLCLAGFYYLYNSEPLSAWKMFHQARLCTETTMPMHDRKMSDGSNSVDDKEVQMLERKVFEICLRYECHLQSELEVPISPSLQYVPDEPNRLSLSPSDQDGSLVFETKVVSEFHEADLSLLRIRQRTLRSSRAVHAQSSWKEVSAIFTQLSTMESKLDAWYTILPPSMKFPMPGLADHDVNLVDHHGRLLQHRYFEVKELTLRPWLYMYLLTNSASSGKIKSAFNAIEAAAIRDHVTSQTPKKMAEHQACVILRLDLLMKWDQRVNLTVLSLEGPWIWTQNCVSLALLLIASLRQDLGLFAPSQSKEDCANRTLDNLENILGGSRTLGNAKEYASLIHKLREG